MKRPVPLGSVARGDTGPVRTRGSECGISALMRQPKLPPALWLLVFQGAHNLHPKVASQCRNFVEANAAERKLMSGARTEPGPNQVLFYVLIHAQNTPRMLLVTIR